MTSQRKRRHSPARPHDGFAPPQDVEAYEDGAVYGSDETAAVADVSRLTLASRLVRGLLWTLIITSPLLALAAFAQASNGGSSPAAKPAPAKAASSSDGSGAAGFAELFVTAYTAAGRGQESSLVPYYPAAKQLRLTTDPGTVRADQATTVGMRQGPHGAWSITVAVRLETTPAAKSRGKGRAERDEEDAQPALRYFQVPVQAATQKAGSRAYVALALPSEVAAPKQAKTPALAYGQMAPASDQDPRVQTARSFLASYLAGQGDLSRYLSPRTRLSPVTPAPYEAVEVEEFAADRQMGEGPPPDGVRMRLLIQATATRGEQATPLQYALTLTSRAGRWEVTSLDPAPAFATTPNPTS
ncbi:conjugal transfer protein [Streptomyces sp. A7024]|uniref:Conjugal transfer protein n=1 Tax=Streptomyces coryli TaxID=1128680 RepID=A0A6G4TW13_9ACTN|nr:conjugal transfer protein [Streptomyces coryli]NGN63191.1 conjugal transfer protein [Streptomyces coryli]